MDDVKDQLADIRQRMAAACARAGRPIEAVRLLAVSKNFPPEVLAAAAAQGQTDYAESYVQEAIGKIAATETLAGRRLCWHFIGPIQSNKTGTIAERFDWVHGVERLKIAERLSAQRRADQPVLNLCVQVNVSGEASKSGCAPPVAAALCAAVAALPKVRLRGLMTIPAAAETAEAARPAFRALRALHTAIRERGLVDGAQFDTLSMGMSGDFEVAIEEGATLVRIGSALFGRRD